MRWLLGLLAGVCLLLAIVNAVRLVPYESVWGDVGTWAQALLTGGGLVFAGLSVRLAAKQMELSRAREESRRSESKEVARHGLVLRSSWGLKPELLPHAGQLSYNYEIANMSAFPVSNCKISIHALGDGNADLYDLESALDADDFYQAVVVGTLVPGEIVRGRVIVRNPRAAIGLWGNDRVANPDLSFTDAWGTHWLRPRTTHFREVAPDEAQEHPECMCCGLLPDSREYIGARPAST